jgi:hypothetical protein
MELKHQRKLSKYKFTIIRETNYIINKLTIGLLLVGQNSSPARVETFISPNRPVRLLGPTKLLSNVSQALPRGVKRQVREAYLPPTTHPLPTRLQDVVVT